MSQFSNQDRHPAVQVACGRCDTDAADDWDLMFDAVRIRLRQTASGVAPAGSDLARLQARVLECVEALELLHRALGERGGRRHFEHELFDARVGRARAGLASGQIQILPRKLQS